MANKLIGQDFEPHDVVAKVTGRAKYAEDFRAEGMVFCKLLTSPMPHARIRNIDASAALKMPGVFGMLTADDVPQFQIDPFWPKPLPNNWILGQVAGIATDKYDRVWVVQRPLSLTPRERAAEQNPPEAKCCRAAPPVLLFDAAFVGRTGSRLSVA